MIDKAALDRFVKSKRQIVREIAHHEILLAFYSDDAADQFSEWLNEEGWEHYNKWARARVVDEDEMIPYQRIIE